ncbi:MAG TPA: hypothetical protein VJ901_12265 [Thermoanaerobaculia bacterium]|nr:hypothetical protein [Thermoanaerobaculia bacterium]
MKTTGSLLAGLATIFVVTTAVDVVLHATGVFPPWGQPMSDALFALAVAYRTIICIFGCWLTARLAPREPMKHALILGAIGLVLTAGVTIATWNKGPAFGPHWYPIALIALALPCAWMGGRLRAA